MGDQPASPGVLIRRLLLTLALCIGIVAGGLALFRLLAAQAKEPQRQEQAARAVAVRVAPVERVDYRERLSGYGRARALRHARLAAEVPGVIRWISPRLEAGLAVEEGEVLVRLDDRDLKEAVQSAAARVARIAADAKRLESEIETSQRKAALAKRELDASNRELKRIESLQGSNAATDSDYDRQTMASALREAALIELEGRVRSLQTQLERNRADQQEAEASLRKTQLDLERTEVRAPFAGRIDQRQVNVGDRVATGNVLCGVLDLSRVEIPIALAARHYGEVTQGAAAEVVIGEEDWQGTVARVSPVVSERDRTFFAYLVVETPPDGKPVPPGAFVRATIDGRRFEDVFVLPRSAFVGDEVFVVEQGVARVRTPRVVARLAHAIVADDGLEPGALLIRTNLEEVAAGTRVAPTRARKAGAPTARDEDS